jgi:hypothetical protein
MCPGYPFLPLDIMVAVIRFFWYLKNHSAVSMFGGRRGKLIGRFLLPGFI